MNEVNDILKEMEAHIGVCSCKKYHCGLCGSQTDTPALSGHADNIHLIAALEECIEQRDAYMYYARLGALGSPLTTHREQQDNKLVKILQGEK